MFPSKNLSSPDSQTQNENISPFPKQPLVFTCLQYKSFENTVGKGETAHNEQFLLFPVFLTHLENFLPDARI